MVARKVHLRLLCSSRVSSLGFMDTVRSALSMRSRWLMLSGWFPNSPNWVSAASTACSAIFIVLCLISISDSKLGILRSKQGMQLSQLGSVSIAPENLPAAGKTLRLRLAAENHDAEVGNASRELAWMTFQNTLSAYAERLKLLDRQSEELDNRLQRRSLWISLAALAAILANSLLLAFQKAAQKKASVRAVGSEE
jgi:hypothetical protein